MLIDRTKKFKENEGKQRLSSMQLNVQEGERQGKLQTKNLMTITTGSSKRRYIETEKVPHGRDRH